MSDYGSAQKRQQIVDTAYRLFKRDGFHATGIDRIIAEADVAKMTMYRHFPNKDGLIVAVLRQRAERFERQLDRLAEQALTPEEKVSAIFDWYGRWFRGPAFHGCLFAHAVAEFGHPGHPVFEAATAQKEALRQRFADLMAERVSVERAASLGSALLMLIEGATLMAEMGHDRAIENARCAALSLVWAATAQK
jgi:AcrR family transcriptional regulator